MGRGKKAGSGNKPLFSSASVEPTVNPKMLHIEVKNRTKIKFAGCVGVSPRSQIFLVNPRVPERGQLPAADLLLSQLH